MKQFVIVSRYQHHPHASILNGAIFNSKQEAMKVAEFHSLKFKTVDRLTREFWKENGVMDEPRMEVVEIKVPEVFWKD